MKMAVAPEVVCDALLEAVQESSSLQALTHTLRLTIPTLQMAASALAGSGDCGDEAALLAVACRLFPGPYAAASVLGVPAGELALFGEHLLTLMDRAQPAKVA